MKMTTVATAELSGRAFDWVLAGIAGREYFQAQILLCPISYVYRGSTDWSTAGPIIDHLSEKGFHLKTWLESQPETKCEAHLHNLDGDWVAFGPTPLIAAMRCYVASKLGDEVQVPAELLA